MMKNYKKRYLERNASFKGSFVREDSPFYGNKCLYCYERLYNNETDFHQACNKRFFGQLNTPVLAYNYSDLQNLANQVIQSQMAVTGVQAKISLSLFKKQDKNTLKKLTIVGLYGDYILKPPSAFYPQLPELESVTMKMAECCGLPTVPFSLVRLQDDTLCYLTKRVDRSRKGKLHMEDFCQLSERLTEDKYKGSHEQLAKLIMKYSSSPLLDVSNFYELVLFCFLTGNSDMHLKNFSLLEKEELGMSLSPAYDLVPTVLVNPSDKEELALTLNAKKSKLKYDDFLAAYNLSGLRQKVLDKTLELFKYAKPELMELLEKSLVNDEFKVAYRNLLNERFERLGLS